MGQNMKNTAFIIKIQDAENNEIKWEATRVITKIIDTPAWPILAASSSTDHIRSVAQILTSKSSQSKWLDKLESGRGEIIDL